MHYIFFLGTICTYSLFISYDISVEASKLWFTDNLKSKIHHQEHWGIHTVLSPWAMQYYLRAEPDELRHIQKETVGIHGVTWVVLVCPVLPAHCHFYMYFCTAIPRPLYTFVKHGGQCTSHVMTCLKAQKLWHKAYQERTLDSSSGFVLLLV